MNIIQTTDRVVSSNTTIVNQTLVGGTLVHPAAGAQQLQAKSLQTDSLTVESEPHAEPEPAKDNIDIASEEPARTEGRACDESFGFSQTAEFGVGQTNFVIKCTLQKNFGVCGWSSGSDNNPIPFTLNPQTNLKISSYPAADWIYGAVPNGNSLAYNVPAGAGLDQNTHVHCYPNAFADIQCPISVKPGLITLQSPPPYGLFKGQVKFRLKNISRLGADEYQYDYGKGQINLAAAGGAADPIYISAGQHCILSLNNVTNCVFNNVTFVGGVDGVHINNSAHVSFINCKFLNIPKTALSITASSNITIQGCSFLNIGYGALLLSACGSAAALTNANILIKDCVFKNCNKTRYSNAAVIRTSNGVGLTINNCAFYNSTAAAIDCDANNTAISQCYFESCCDQSTDYGVIYAGRSLIRRGLVIHDCYFKTLEFSPCSPRHFIYCDDGYSGAHVYNCVFEQVGSTNDCFYSSGRDHLVENCTFINVFRAVRIPVPRALKAVCITEYNALMANAAQKKIYVAAYPALATPIDFLKGYMVPSQTMKNCNLCFDDPSKKVVSGYVSIPAEAVFVQTGNKILPATARHLPDGSVISIPIAGITL